MLRIANGCVADLEKELRIAEEEIRIAGEELRYERAEADPLYQRVGLSQNAPSWLVVDARRCFAGNCILIVIQSMARNWRTNSS